MTRFLESLPKAISYQHTVRILLASSLVMCWATQEIQAQNLINQTTAAWLDYEGTNYQIYVIVPQGTDATKATKMLLDGTHSGIIVAKTKAPWGIESWVTDQMGAFRIVNSWLLQVGFHMQRTYDLSMLLEARRRELQNFMANLLNKPLTASATVPIVNYQIGGYNIDQVINIYNMVCKIYSCNLDANKLDELAKWSVTTSVKSGAKWLTQNVLISAIRTVWVTKSFYLGKVAANALLANFTAGAMASIAAGAVGGYIIGQGLDMGDFSYWATMMKKSAEAAEFYARECLPTATLDYTDHMEHALYGYIGALLAAQTHFEYAEKFWEFCRQRASGPEVGDPDAQLLIAQNNLAKIKSWKKDYLDQFFYNTAAGVRDGGDWLISQGLLPDLAGTWVGGKAQITQDGSYLTVDMPGRGQFTGKLLTTKKIDVKFDSYCCTGEIISENKIKWSNNTTWNKETDVISGYPDLTGTWVGGKAIITQTGDKLTVKMPGRATFYGSFTSPNEIKVDFTDDRPCCTGTVVSQDRINWSNGSVWHRKK